MGCTGVEPNLLDAQLKPALNLDSHVNGVFFKELMSDADQIVDSMSISGPRPSLGRAVLPGLGGQEDHHNLDENNDLHQSRAVGTSWSPKSNKNAVGDVSNRPASDQVWQANGTLTRADRSNVQGSNGVPKRLRDLKVVGGDYAAKLVRRSESKRSLEYQSHKQERNGYSTDKSNRQEHIDDREAAKVSVTENGASLAYGSEKELPLNGSSDHTKLDLVSKASSESLKNLLGNSEGNSELNGEPKPVKRVLQDCILDEQVSGNLLDANGDGLHKDLLPSESHSEISEDQESSARPPHSRTRRTSRSRRSAVFMEAKEGVRTDESFDIFHNQTVFSSFHAARRKEITRTRWVKAIWYATEEAHRRRAERKKLLSSMEASTKRKQSYVPLEKRLSLSNADNETQAQPNQSLVRVPTAAAGNRSESPVQADGNICCKTPFVLQFIVLTSLTYLLFVVDLYVIFTAGMPRSDEIAVYSLVALCFVVLTVDLVLGILLNPDFRGKTQMWLEVLVVASLVPDLVIFAMLVRSQGVEENNDVTEMLYLVRLWRLAGMVTRAGTRASRSLRVLHMVNVMSRKNQSGSKKVQPVTTVQESNTAKDSEEKEEDDYFYREAHKEQIGKTSIGHELDHCVSNHYIALVGLMLFSRLGSEVLIGCNKAEQAETNLHLLSMASYGCNQMELNASCNENLVRSFAERAEWSGQNLLYLKLGGMVLFGNESSRMRYRVYPYPETLVAYLPSKASNSSDSVLHLLNRQSVVMECWMNVIESLTLIVFLVIVSTSLSSLIRLQVVIPLQRIVRTVLALETDPLRPLRRKKRKEFERKLHEVKLIENAIHKIAALMQLGFGEAGANIIKENMKLGDKVEVNSDVPGKVVHAIYGFCDIRNFTDCTEVLQGEVVKLVNEVAYLVHEAVVDNLGAPNKNIGDAFLLVWKPKGAHSITAVAESALRSYIRTIIEISRCKKLDRWANRAEIQQRLPGFQVRMGFGMHYGWAIEGAIGSLHKIDASYLSPHVNMASRLEAATKQYGVYILFSEDVHALLSPAIQDLCRRVDRVTLKGSSKPLKLYTYDTPLIKGRGGELDDNEDLSSKVELHDFFNRVAPPSTDSGFRNLWSFAIDLYLGGPGGNTADWRSARKILQDLCQQVPKDGPARTLLAVMDRLQQPDGAAPADWKGFRSLDEK